MSDKTRVLVTGAGGFIGNHLVDYLKARDYWVRGVDIKEPEFSDTNADEFELLDLRRWDSCLQATRGVEHVYALAADMGGMGFISGNHSRILLNNALINFHTLSAAQTNGGEPAAEAEIVEPDVEPDLEPELEPEAEALAPEPEPELEPADPNGDRSEPDYVPMSEWIDDFERRGR